jgi:hypothetical protein
MEKTKDILHVMNALGHLRRARFSLAAIAIVTVRSL